MTDDERFIDCDAVLVEQRSTHYATWYECGCYEYFGDIDAPHQRPCDDHAVTLDEL